MSYVLQALQALQAAAREMISEFLASPCLLPHVRSTKRGWLSGGLKRSMGLDTRGSIEALHEYCSPAKGPVVAATATSPPPWHGKRESVLSASWVEREQRRRKMLL